ncbi:MAG: hypothetical protein RJA70_4861, partial [Pseudomonadota bacterium]
MTRIRTTRWLPLALVLQAVACSGDTTEVGNPAGPGGANSAAPPTELVPPGQPPPAPPAVPTLESTAGPTAGRRLTKDEYVNSVADLFGAAATSPADRLAGESSQALHFRNDLAQLGIDDSRVSNYELAAGEIVGLVPADALMKYGSCADLQPACKDAFVAELGRHVYRRPLAAPE